MFEITSTTEATLKSVTPRTERHGEDDVFAVSLGLKITGPNTLLDLVQPGLLDGLYTAPPEHQPELPGVEAAKPLLRASGVESTKLTATFDGWTLAIDRGIDQDDPIVLGGCKVDAFTVVAHQGGSVDIHFRVGSNDIAADEAGWLCAHLKQAIFVTLKAPVKTDTIDGTVEAFERDHPPADGQGSLLDKDADEATATERFVEQHGSPVAH